MRNSRHFIGLAKSKGARTLAALAMTLLVIEPYAYALNQIVSKYPTGSPTIGSVDMDPGAGVNTLYYGSVFGFNSAKAMSQTTAYAEVGEGACIPEGTNYTFISGMEGWNGLTTNAQFPGGADIGTRESYMFDSTIGGGSLKTAMARKGTTEKFTWERKFFYDCGQPAALTFQLQYTRGLWIYPSGTASTFQVQLFKPSDINFASPIQLAASTNITATSLTNYPASPAAIATSSLNEVGTYTIRIVGTLITANTVGANLEVAFDNINLAVTPQAAYTSFKQDVEITSSAVPLSSTNSYTLEIRAIKASAGAENVEVWVYDATAGDTGQGAGWVYKTTINNTTHIDTSWADLKYDPDYSIPLNVNEYNGGNVRVRYIDAVPTSDNAQDIFFLDYQRVTVDQGACVDSVTDSDSDCGKCHNYNGDITKPWPSIGMHNKHAQTESINDCLWCHPSSGYNSSHRDGVVEIDGTIVSALASPANGGTANSYNPGTKVCSNIYCHDPNTLGQSSPAWDSVYGTNIERNCSRCHNGGSPAADNAADLNIASAWPNAGDGGGHSKHDVAFNLDEASCQSSGSCHPDNRSQHSVVGDSKIEVVMSSAYASPNKIPKFIEDTTNGTGTCVNMACHGGQQTPRFNTADTNPPFGPIDVATQCTKCHTAEKGDGWGTAAGMASQWNSPISGLHRGSPPTSGKSHIADYGCTQCHNEPVNHFMTAGVSNLTDTAMDLLTAGDFKPAVGNLTLGSGGTRPNWTTPTTCGTPQGAYGNPQPDGVGCHADANTDYRGTGTPWSRRWSWDSYSTTQVVRCTGCHGHWNSFNAGVAQPHVTSNSDGTLLSTLQGNHQDAANGVDCATLCHATDVTGTQGFANYNHGVAMTATSKTMDINTNVTRVDNGSNIGCSNCHNASDGAPDGALGSHTFDDNQWATLVRPVGPASGGCITCHGDTTLNPANIGGVTGGNGTFDTASTHRHHGGGATRYGAVSDEVCTVCHNNSLQNMTEGGGATTYDIIQLKNADTGANILWNQGSPSDANVVAFCTSCHDADGALATYASGGSPTNPFAEASAPTPWSRYDIGSKYNSTVTGPTHTYNYNNTPQLTKARSPHGKPTLNDMKQSTDQSTYTDANPVGCQNCHPAHGSATDNAKTKGWNKGGIVVNTAMMNPTYSDPGTCWACHNNPASPSLTTRAAVWVKDYYGDSKDLNATSGNWNSGSSNTAGLNKSAFAYKERAIRSTHQVKSSTMSAKQSNGASPTAADVATTNTACGICHDPHGAVTWAAQGSQQLQAFSLRGNWMTSPYLEDRACDRSGTATGVAGSIGGHAGVETQAGPRQESTAAYNRPNKLGNGYDQAGGSGHEGFFIDDNTFGVSGSTYNAVTVNYMTQTSAQFGGLCASCHTDASFSGSGADATARDTNMKNYLKTNNSTDWAGGKIHQTVKGWVTSPSTEVTDIVNSTNNPKMHNLHSGNSQSPWGVVSASCYAARYLFTWGVNLTNGTKQAYHQFSCSKCHTPHASSQPRLMVSNCLDLGSGTGASKSHGIDTPYTYPNWGSGMNNGPIATLAAVGASGMSEIGMHCHNKRKTNTAGGGGWNQLTGW